jgi:hypothetical protein
MKKEARISEIESGVSTLIGEFHDAKGPRPDWEHGVTPLLEELLVLMKYPNDRAAIRDWTERFHGHLVTNRI